MCCAASARQVLYWHAHQGNACWQGSGPALAAPSVSALCHSRCCKASGISWCRSRQALEQAPPSTRAATAPCVLRRHKGWPPSKEHVLPFACSTTHTSVKSEAAHAPTQLQAPLYIRNVGSLESQAWNTRIKPSNCTCHQQDPWMQWRRPRCRCCPLSSASEAPKQREWPADRVPGLVMDSRTVSSFVMTIQVILRPI